MGSGSQFFGSWDIGLGADGSPVQESPAEGQPGVGHTCRIARLSSSISLSARSNIPHQLSWTFTGADNWDFSAVGGPPTLQVVPTRFSDGG